MRKLRKTLVWVRHYHLFFDLTVPKPLFCFIFVSVFLLRPSNARFVFHSSTLCSGNRSCTFQMRLHPLYRDKSYPSFHPLSLSPSHSVRWRTICIHFIIVMMLTMIDEFKMNVHSMLDSHFFVRLPMFYLTLSLGLSMTLTFFSLATIRYSNELNKCEIFDEISSFNIFCRSIFFMPFQC